jgi:hypothetical protein
VNVFEAVGDSARDKDGVAGAALHRLAIDGIGQDTLEAEGGLIVGVVAVGRRDFGSSATSNSNMATKCHLNYAVADTLRWEQSATY